MDFLAAAYRMLAVYSFTRHVRLPAQSHQFQQLPKLVVDPIDVFITPFSGPTSKRAQQEYTQAQNV